MKIFYILECDNLYKIGYTVNIQKRLKELTTGNPITINIIYTYHSEFAVKIEGYFHRMFKLKQIKNEWFDLTLSDIELIKTNIKTIENNFKVLSKENYFYK